MGTLDLHTAYWTRIQNQCASRLHVVCICPVHFAHFQFPTLKMVLLCVGCIAFPCVLSQGREVDDQLMHE